jgi:hypothetical protein
VATHKKCAEGNRGCITCHRLQGEREGEKTLWDERDGMRGVSSEMGIKKLLQAAKDKGKRKREWEIGRGGGGEGSA